MTKVVAAKEQNTALAEMNDMLLEDAGAGYGNAAAECFALPFLRVLQTNSPTVDPDSDAYIKGHMAGMLFNSATGKAYDGKVGLNVIPCEFRWSYIEWAPRSAGAGGYKGEHAPDSAVVGTASRVVQTTSSGERTVLQLPNGNELADTRTHYVLYQDPDTGAWLPAVLAMNSTQIKKSKKFLAQVNARTLRVGERTIRPPAWAFMYKLTTVSEENAKGKFKGFRIDEGPQVTDPETYAAAREFAQQVRSGQATVQHADNADDTAPADLDNDM